MFKRIKIIKDYMDNDNRNINGNKYDSLVTEDDCGNTYAAFDVGAGCPYILNNYVDGDKFFEIIWDIDLTDKLSQSYDHIESLKNDLASAEDEISNLSDKVNELSRKNSDKIERNHINDGYIILPASALDKELADELINNEYIIIKPKEIIAMSLSAQMEINKGDNRPTSLNVKLYRAINDFCEHELDKIIENGKAN